MQKKLISNEFRCSSLSIREVEAEANEKQGLGEDPLDILIAEEESEDEDAGFIRSNN